MMNFISRTAFVSMFFWWANVCAQPGSMNLVFVPIYGSETIHLADSTFIPEGKGDIAIETLKFYVTNIRFLQNNQVVFEEPNSVHLIDVGMVSTLVISLQMPEEIDFNALQFDLGIDSLKNVSGAMGGDLDPTNGMYWTWQSGYINFKLEGRCIQSPARNNEFQFHLGGYQDPYNCLQTLNFKLKDKSQINISIDIARIIKQIDFTQEHHIMSPGQDALRLAGIGASAFNIRS